MNDRERKGTVGAAAASPTLSRDRRRASRVVGFVRALCAVGVPLAMAGTGPAGAQPDHPRIDVPTIAGAEVRLDGVLDEPAWAQAAVIDGLTQHEPNPGESTPFATRILLLSDGASFYLGIDCTDPEPGRIVTHSLQRDGNIEGDDSVDFVLDTFGDRATAYWFLVTAAGARADGLVAAGTGFPSLDWDGIWDAEARRTSHGWSAEVVIPAHTLRFRPGSQAWGFNIARQIARRQMILRWTAIPHDAAFFDMRQAGTLAGLGEMEQGHGLAFAPFAVGGTSRERPAVRDEELRGGFDLTYSPTPEITGVATFRTDFAETEVDARQVNLTRFPLFFPEKRSFFLEGSNQFDFAYGLDTDFIPFFSRRIGLFAGQEVPIDGGLKLLGHVGRLSFGALGVRTRSSPGAPPETTLTAGRATYDWGTHWRVGSIFTSGEPDGVRDNRLVGVDALYRSTTFRGDKNLIASFWGARSGGDTRPGRTSGWGARLEYPNDRWYLSADVKEFGDALDPALGFLPRPGTRWYELGSAFQPRPRADGRFGWARQFFFENFDYLITDLDGRTESWRVFLAPFNVVTRSGDHFEANVVPYFERLSEPFSIAPGVTLAPGSYRYTRYRVEAEAAASRRLRPTLAIWFGPFFDGRLEQWIASLGWSSAAGHLRLELSGELDSAHLPAGDFTQRLAGLRAVYAFTPDLALSSFTQYDSLSRSLGSNNLLRWTIRPGRDLYVVLNRSWDRGIGSALALAPRDDQVSAKLRWTFWR